LTFSFELHYILNILQHPPFTKLSNAFYYLTTVTTVLQYKPLVYVLIIVAKFAISMIAE